MEKNSIGKSPKSGRGILLQIYNFLIYEMNIAFFIANGSGLNRTLLQKSCISQFESHYEMHFPFLEISIQITILRGPIYAYPLIDLSGRAFPQFARNCRKSAVIQTKPFWKIFRRQRFFYVAFLDLGKGIFSTISFTRPYATLYPL